MSNLNLKYYDGNSLFVYPSLKKINSNVLKIIKKAEDFQNIKSEIPSEFLKFTNPQKVNNLKIFKFTKDDEVLEINACFGVTTQYLCDKVKKVTAIEFSKQNADIILERLMKKNNLEIMVGNISKMEFKKQFDYIILNDILEFANFFFSSINPSREFIKFCKNLLKPNGTIILQTNNRFGIKNWLGEVDDHTGNIFDGLTNYPKYSLNSFSKKELLALLGEAGFEYIKFLYPQPDHNFTQEIFSDDTLNNKKIDYFNKKTTDLIETIQKRNEFDFFTNSFLIIAKTENCDCEINLDFGEEQNKNE